MRHGYLCLAQQKVHFTVLNAKWSKLSPQTARNKSDRRVNPTSYQQVFLSSSMIVPPCLRATFVRSKRSTPFRIGCHRYAPFCPV